MTGGSGVSELWGMHLPLLLPARLWLFGVDDCIVWGAQIANDVMREAGVPVVAAWNETLPLWDYHRCIHPWTHRTFLCRFIQGCCPPCPPAWHAMHALCRCAPRGPSEGFVLWVGHGACLAEAQRGW